MIATPKDVIAKEEQKALAINSMDYFLDGKRVLLAGTNEVDEMLLAYMIRQSGGILNVASDMEEVKKTLSKSRYDLIIMNSRLGNENAMGLLQQLRRESLVNSPVIAISSNDLNGRALHNGFAYVLRRPLEKRKILAALSTIFRN